MKGIDMKTVEEIVTEVEMKDAFAYANFGSMPHREVLSVGVLKCASGYYQGHTSMTILIELGLITEDYIITVKGQMYLWVAFYGGSKL